MQTFALASRPLASLIARGFPLHPAQALPPCIRLKDRKPCFGWHGFLLCGLVHGGAFWCQRYRAIRGWTWDCGAHEHQRASATEAVQSVVKVIFVRLVASDVRRRCRRCGYVQRLQQITKLSGCCCQLIPDDGANRLPKPFIRGCLAIDSLQRLLQAHAIADVDFDDLHIHKVPLFQLFGVKFSFLFVIFCLGVPCLFPARNLVWLTVSPEEALASGEGTCNSGIRENRKVVAVYRAKGFGCSCRGSYDPWSHEHDTAIPVMTLRSPQI